MKTFKIITIILILTFPSSLLGQDIMEYGNVLQSYYLKQDKNLHKKTIEILNGPIAEHIITEPILTGFFGALFSENSGIKDTFSSSIDKLQNPKFKDLFKYLTSTKIDSIYSKIPISPDYNDMNWASFFATGITKFLDNIIANISLAENRIDRNLFLTGASAKWSLCSNAKKDNKIKNHLIGLKGSISGVNEILKKEPYVFQEEMITVIKKQREKGYWTEE